MVEQSSVDRNRAGATKRYVYGKTSEMWWQSVGFVSSLGNPSFANIRKRQISGERTIMCCTDWFDGTFRRRFSEIIRT
jgi:hypothetical protein